MNSVIVVSLLAVVVKEKLPRERESRFWPLALGAAVYAAILLAL